MTWSADFPADDWKHISANEIAARALQRIEARGRGMLLLHDIKPATALAHAGHPQRAEAPRLSHRPCRAGDAGSRQDGDASLAMAGSQERQVAVAGAEHRTFCSSSRSCRPLRR